MSAILTISTVSKSYQPHGRKPVHALKDASLTLKPGDLEFVCGSSGSGKSTLLLCCGGLLQPDSGTVMLGDIDLYSLGSEDRSAVRAKTIGFVFQQFHLIPYLSVIDNVLAPTLAGFDGDPSQRANELIEQFGLTDRRDHPPSELSIGERQRVALARALLRNPMLILADEPTGNLDTANGDRVMEALQAFAAAGGAVLIVTHDRNRVLKTPWTLDHGTLKPPATAIA